MLISSRVQGTFRQAPTLLRQIVIGFDQVDVVGHGLREKMQGNHVASFAFSASRWEASLLIHASLAFDNIERPLLMSTNQKVISAFGRAWKFPTLGELRRVSE